MISLLINHQFFLDSISISGFNETEIGVFFIGTAIKGPCTSWGIGGLLVILHRAYNQRIKWTNPIIGKKPANPKILILTEAIGGPIIMPSPEAKIKVPAAEVICLEDKKSFA